MENEHIEEMENFDDELLPILRAGLSAEELRDKISDYHEKDIAEALQQLTEEERKDLYPKIGAELLSEIFAYVEDIDEYFLELSIEQGAEVLSYMDSDDAVDVLEEFDEDLQEQLIDLMDDEAGEDVELIQSYEDEEIGSHMTTNFILINKNLSIREAMRSLIDQAGENDNISTIYVQDEKNEYCGAIELKDLIIARDGVQVLDDLILASYPHLSDHSLISDVIEEIKDYSEDSLPVLNSKNEVIGVITSQDIVEAVDEEMGDDYAKLAGLTSEEDLKETLFESMKKRLPWLFALLFLGIGVSTVVGVFEEVVAVIPIVICFQSLILDMAGNVGTQSLAVTIRVLMDENLSAKDKVHLVFKEVRVGLSNGLILGLISFVLIGLYVHFLKGNPLLNSFLISGCVGVALMAAMAISSLVGTLVPLFFNKLGVDPAVASGPLITTVNDLVAVVTYYGLAWILLINIFHIV